MPLKFVPAGLATGEGAAVLFGAAAGGVDRSADESVFLSQPDSRRQTIASSTGNQRVPKWRANGAPIRQPGARPWENVLPKVIFALAPHPGPLPEERESLRAPSLISAHSEFALRT